MHAVLRIDLQALLSALADIFIHACRTIARLRSRILCKVDLRWHIGVSQRQMRGLMFIVIGVGNEHRRQSIKGQCAIRFGVDDRLALIRRFQALMIGMRVMQSPGCFTAEDQLINTHHQCAGVKAFAHPGLEVACDMQFFVQPGLFESGCVGAQFILCAFGSNRIERSFGSEHAGLHRAMAALDAAGIQEAGIAANQRAAGEGQFGQRLQTTRRDGPRAIRQTLAAFKEAANRRMRFIALKFFVGRQVGILVGETDHIADHHLIVFHVVQEGAAIGAAVQRPACGVDHQTGLVLGGIDFPQLLDADAVGLRITSFVELIAGDQLLAEMAACAFGKQGVLGAQFHAQLKFAGGLAFFVYPQIAGRHTDHGALLITEDFGRGKARENLHPQIFGLLREPAHDIAERDNVIAVVLKAAGQHPVGYGGRALLGQEEEAIFRDGREQRGTFGFPVGE